MKKRHFFYRKRGINPDKTYPDSANENAESTQPDQSSDDGKTTVFTGSETLRQNQESDEHKDASILDPAQLTGPGYTSLPSLSGRAPSSKFVLGTVLTTVKIIVVCIVALVSVVCGSLFGMANAYLGTTPELDLEQISDVSTPSYIYDSSGTLLTTYTGLEISEYASLDDIPQHLQDCVIANEDVRFYHHNGVDFKGTLSSLLSNLTGGAIRGGSTITQQLIKNKLLSSERSYKRKLQEAKLAMELETRYSKDQILEAYLNTIPLGGNIYGVKAAAKDYLGKSLDQLTLREMAMLAGITQYPTKYNPRSCYYGNDSASRVAALNARIDDVLAKTYSAGYITKEEYETALSDTIEILPESSSTELYQYPHFVEYAIYDVVTHMLRDRDLIDNTVNRAAMENELRTGGYHIYTTLDTSMQETLQSTISNYSSYPRLVNSAYSVKSETLSDGTVIETKEPQAASVIMEQGTGYLRAIVSSRDEPTIKRSLNRAYQSRMAVGSSIKPIAVYGPALDKGDGLGTVVPYIPAEIDGWISSAGYPTSDSRRPYGPVTIRRGIVSSLNIVAARVLMSDVGLEDSYSYLLKLGISEKRLSKTGVGLALGSSGITVIEMSGAYAALANGGTYIEPISFTHVTDKSGNTVMSAATTQRTEQVYKPSTAYMLIDALTDAVKSGTGTNAQISGMTVAGKTGTNADNKGVFFAGVTPYYVSTVWVGHDDDKPLRSTSGGSGAAPLWRQYMSKILQGKEDKQILSGSMSDYGVVEATVCSVSGMLPTGACYADTGGHRPVKELFAAGDVPTEECTMHSYKTVCSVSGMRATSYCPGTKSGGVVDISGTEYEKLSTSQLHSCFSNLATNGSYCSIHTKSWYIDSQTPSQPEESDTSESPEPSESASPESSSGAAEAEGNANAAE